MELNFKIISIFIFTYFLIFISFYSVSKTYATIHFDAKRINASHSTSYGEVFCSRNGEFSKSNSKPFLYWRGLNHDFQSFNVPIFSKSIKYIRFDPLRDSGEIFLKNFLIIQGAGFNQKIQKIDFRDINLNQLHNIKIIQKEKNLLHLLATGNDPHLEITNSLDITSPITNYIELIKISILSLIVLIILSYIIKGFRSNYLKGEEIITGVVLLIYSSYTVLYGTQFGLAALLLTYLPIFVIFIVYKQGLLNYISYIRNMIIIVLILGIISFIINLSNDIKSIDYFLFSLPNIFFSMFIAMIFIQKKAFNYHFYKYFLTILTISIAIFTIFLHYKIIRIDTTIALGYAMSMHVWAQKNYTFWYLFLMWGTISFFHLNKVNKNELYLIVAILLVSSIMIMSGYSDSSKLAFFASLIVYLLFTFVQFNIKTLMIIPIVLSLYILLTPWIADLFVQLSTVHTRLGWREPIFAIYSSVIKHNLIFGYGFNSTGAIVPSDFVSPDILEKYAHNKYMHKCSPHSTTLLIWLNFGILGASALSLLVYVATKNFIRLTYNKNNQAALLALIISFVIIITFSWGTWQAHSLLTFSFFIGMIFLSLNINTNNTKSIK